MKSRKVILVFACLTMFEGNAISQTQYEAARLSGSELDGTARFVSMGGAMSALGADISTIGTNPAGIGLFRSNEVSVTGGLSVTKTESNFGGYTANESRTKATFDQLGFVCSTKIGNRTSVRYVNFAFNYHKRKDFNRNFCSEGYLGGLSQTQQMATMMENAIDDISEVDDIYDYMSGSGNPYSVTGSNYPYLGVMGVRTELVAVNSDESGLIGWNGDYSKYISHEEGGIDEYDFNVALNIDDRFYIGATVGVYDIDYKLSTYYTEDIYDGDHVGYYEHCNWFRTEGVGIDFKLGIIVRPVEESPFRIGLAVHTPTWYTLTDTYYSDIYSYINYSGEDTFEAEEFTPDYVGGALYTDYNLRTPWKFNVSAGTTFGNKIAVGAEYEFADYGSSKLYYDDDSEMYTQNQYIKEDLKGMHTVRVGMEARCTPEFTVRVGYNYSTSGYEKTAYKALEWNDLRTDTEYSNNRDRHVVTAGLGYRKNGFTVDLAYKYDLLQQDFYAFSDDDLNAAKVDNARHKLLLTLGMKF